VYFDEGFETDMSVPVAEHRGHGAPQSKRQRRGEDGGAVHEQPLPVEPLAGAQHPVPAKAPRRRSPPRQRRGCRLPGRATASV